MPKPQKKRNGVFVVNVSFLRKRTKITLGKVSRIEANLFCANIEQLADFRRRGVKIDASLTKFINRLPSDHFEQLRKISLIKGHDKGLTVAGLIKKFQADYEERHDIEASTKKRMDRALRRFPSWFQELVVEDMVPLKDVDRENAEPTFTAEQKKVLKNVESHMRNHFARATWSRTHGNLREVGNWAVRNGYVDHNPFRPLPCPAQTNESKNIYVETEWVEDAIEQSRCSDTRIAFAIGRYAGFRLHSELRSLKWEHIDLDSETPTIKAFDSKKRKFRQPMPIFPQLKIHLAKHREACAKSNRFILSAEARTKTDNYLYKLMAEAVLRTEFERWDRLRQNLRTSCENDLLAAGFPENLVVAWIGHTVKVSREHYQKVTPRQLTEAFEREVF